MSVTDYDGMTDFDSAVSNELDRLRVRDEARRLHAEATKTPPPLLPSPRSLDAFLSEHDNATEWVIDGLLARGANVVIAAAYKAGKSTLRDNLVAALADGGTFLGAHPTQPRRVTIIDNELDERTMRRWMRQLGIVNRDAVTVLPLRGAVSTFDILDPETRARWAEQLAGTDVVILDCLRPVLDALDLDEHREAGRFLIAFDELKAAAGISEGVIVHHMGHSGERSRGDSRILDWPDATWNIVRESRDNPASPRYFSAFGRDVHVPETRLHFDAASRMLTLGAGDRRGVKSEALLPVVLEYLASQPEALSLRQIQEALTAQGHSRDPIRDALKAAVKSGEVLVEAGARNANLHSLNPSCVRVRGSVRFEDAHGENERASVPIGHTARSLAPQGEDASDRAAHSTRDPGYCSSCGMTGKHTGSCKAVTR